MEISKEVIDMRISELKSVRTVFFDEFTKMAKAGNSAMFPLDLLATGIINRSLMIISGFILLIENKNFICAAPLVRLHLDNLLHFYAAFLVQDPHKYATDKIKGKHTRELKDKSGNKMTDSYLVKKFCEDTNNVEFTQLKEVYNEVSGFIHFSDKHIFSSVNKIEGNHLTVKLSDKMEDISLEQEYEAIEVMILITKGIFKYLISWTYTKNHPSKK